MNKNQKPAVKAFATRLKSWQGERTDAAAAAALSVNRRTYEGWKSGRFVPQPFVRQVIEQQMEASK